MITTILIDKVTVKYHQAIKDSIIVIRIVGKTRKNVILCGSLVKLLRGYEILKRVDDCKVFVNSFGGAKVLCIKDHAKPNIRRKNDFNSYREPKLISKLIVDLA